MEIGGLLAWDINRSQRSKIHVGAKERTWCTPINFRPLDTGSEENYGRSEYLGGLLTVLDIQHLFHGPGGLFMAPNMQHLHASGGLLMTQDIQHLLHGPGGLLMA